MKRITLPVATVALALVLGDGYRPARAQQMKTAPLPYTYSYAPQTGTVYYPTSGAVTTRPYASRGVLGAFSRRGGIGTTPFLGNTQGLGAYSRNYNVPARTYYPTAYSYPAQSYVYQGQTYWTYPRQTYTYPVRRGWFR